jgi:hypothetical protein
MSKWNSGHIDSFWDFKHRDLSYQRGRAFNNPEDLKKWEDLGFKLDPAGGDTYDMKNIMPAWADPFFHMFGGDNVGISFFRMRTGDILPAHRDTYKTYIKFHNIENPASVNRAIIFLEDWKPGHIFEIEGTPITKWVAGDYIKWNYNAEHMAANLGLDFRYTLQITFTDTHV